MTYLKTNFPILYEDEELFIISKPAGLHSVMLKKSENISLAELLLNNNPFLAEVSNKTEDAGLLQRLDYDTSGCILGAKNKSAWDALFNALKNGQIQKTYLAISEGIFKENTELRTFIGEKGRHSHKVQIIRTPHQKRILEAFSIFSPLSNNKDLNLSLILASAPTARRHQIRAHLAYLGFPLLGDTLYGAMNSYYFSKRGFFLHANQLTLNHPSSKKILSINSEPEKEIYNYFVDVKNF